MNDAIQHERAKGSRHARGLRRRFPLPFGKRGEGQGEGFRSSAPRLAPFTLPSPPESGGGGRGNPLCSLMS